MKSLKDLENEEHEPKVIVCLNKSRARYVIEDAVITECEICEQEVYASPIALSKQRDENWHIACNDCMDKAHDQGIKIKMQGYVSSKSIEEFDADEDLAKGIIRARIATANMKRVPVKDTDNYRKKD